MQFAPVLPPELYPKMDAGMYHMVQAHLIYSNQRALQWCKDRMSFNHTIILDNGAAELGTGDVPALINTAIAIRPSIIVAPDVFGDRVRTFISFRISAQRMLELAPMVMAVPHGKDVGDSIECLIDMLDFWDKRGYCRSKLIIGVPKLLDTYEPEGRYRFLCNIIDVHRCPQHQIHLLGLNSGLHELDYILKEFPNIMGWDSTWPCAAGLDASSVQQLGITGFTHMKRSLTRQEWKTVEADVDIPQWQTIQSNIEYCRDYTRRAHNDA